MRRTYRIGIDVGLNSCGLAAVEVDGEGRPVRILNAQSVIHDGGVDPSAEKPADSRKKVSGIARRTRRMRRCRRARLAKLDALLRQYGYPVENFEDFSGFDIWKSRARLATDFIEDDAERRRLVSIACRHIARHRGWRNPYHSTETLLNVDAPRSDQYQELRDRAIELMGGEYIDDQATPAQIVAAVLYHDAALGATKDLNGADVPSLRLRTSTGGKKGSRLGLLGTRLMQEDNAYELERILRVQQVPDDQARALVLQVFQAQSPKGSAEKHVGRDPFDSEPRALKASLAFQEYRIANTLTNLCISANPGSGSLTRPLSIAEKQAAFDWLTSDESGENPTWTDIADEVLHIRRSRLKGVGQLKDDGSERVSTRPPQNQTLLALEGIKNSKFRKKLLAWWRDNDKAAQESMIRLLSNTVDIDKVRDDEEYAEAIDFIETLDDDGLQKLDTVKLPAGRAAYSMPSLTKLTEQMLTTDDDLQQARKHLFNVDDSWRPAQPTIGEPLGNPAVDRVLKIVNRYLLACQKRWGDPQAVQIEHTRSGFSSVSTARSYERNNEKRYGYRNEIRRELQQSKGVERPTEGDIRRCEAVQRQNGQCLYCGRPIDFHTCEMDHIVPRKGAGSTNTRDNFAAVCPECNRMKSNTPFARWCQDPDAIARGVSLKTAIERAGHLLIKPKEMNGPQARAFKQGVVQRLKQTEADDPIDNRSMESVSWMADELHRRIDWHFNSRKYGNAETQQESGLTSVSVFPGSATAEARKASGIEGRIHFVGTQYKTRIDRRHHAVDASVIALMNPSAARILGVRSNLRQAQRLSDDQLDTADGETPWKEYPTKSTPGYTHYETWLSDMRHLVDLLNDALDHDRIPVVRWQRLSLGNSLVHDATIHQLRKIRLGDAMDDDLIRRASTPALWCALTRLPDYIPGTGLPADPNRSIQVNGIAYGPQDSIGFFEDDAAQIAINGGSADIGSAIHHARIYRCYSLTKKGARKYFYGMVRVFQTDLLRARNEDLFTYPLPPQSVSMRYASAKVMQAIHEGHAEYLGWLVVGDEIVVPVIGTESTDKHGVFVQFFQDDARINPSITERWVVSGISTASKIELKPSMLAYEGIEKLEKKSGKIVPDAVKLLMHKGWIVETNVLANSNPTVIHRNAFGEPRWMSRAGLPVSWRWGSDQE
ncbi:MAG: HNH endonuclease [Bifidobacteriaceae bacterium]|nr:HNH endonuclease [Bifidobacteriaceae bacterium]